MAKCKHCNNTGIWFNPLAGTLSDLISDDIKVLPKAFCSCEKGKHAYKQEKSAALLKKENFEEYYFFYRHSDTTAELAQVTHKDNPFEQTTQNLN